MQGGREHWAVNYTVTKLNKVQLCPKETKQYGCKFIWTKKAYENKIKNLQTNLVKHHLSKNILFHWIINQNEQKI